jgi:hypothetical protein
MGLAQGPINMVVTNVPGPQFPLFSVGSRLLGMYPTAPLLPGGGLGVALFSYEGKLCWGFQGDRDLVPDLEAFVRDTAIAFEELRTATVARFMAARTAPPEVAPEPVEAVEPEKTDDPPVAPRIEAPMEAENGEIADCDVPAEAGNGETLVYEAPAEGGCTEIVVCETPAEEHPTPIGVSSLN